MDAADICLFPRCRNPRYARGLCKPHYASARRYINSGAADERDLIARGLMLESEREGGRAKHRGVFKKGSSARGKGSES
jgi:hypothetical protein